MGRNIGFVSTRFAGTDGVSLESAKWAQVLWDDQHKSFWFAGKLDRDPGVSMLAPQAWFGEENIAHINRHAYGSRTRSPEITRLISAMTDHLKHQLYEFVQQFEIDILITQNAITIPMNLPLGAALTHFIAETGFPTIAHHHDFYWERDRFSVNSVGDYLSMAFPPDLPSIQHVTINSAAQEDLCHRRGVSSILVPNVLDFEQDPPEPDDYAKSLRDEIGLKDDDIMFLQPTRIVPRKGIEHSIALVSQLNNPKCKLVISHASGDEGSQYCDALVEMAEHQGVDMRFIDQQIDEKRGTRPDGKPVYTLADAYTAADFITYPSLYEGFGNALLEAFYYRKPILVNRYSIYITDIEPRGFQVVSMDGYLTRDTLRHVNRVIADEAYRNEMVNRNYELSKVFFSYSVLKRKLRAMISNFTGDEELSIVNEPSLT